MHHLIMAGRGDLMPRLSRELTFAPHLSFEAWPDVGQERPLITASPPPTLGTVCKKEGKGAALIPPACNIEAIISTWWRSPDRRHRSRTPACGSKTLMSHSRIPQRSTAPSDDRMPVQSLDSLLAIADRSSPLITPLQNPRRTSRSHSSTDGGKRICR
jgi:hypothetical protein